MIQAKGSYQFDRFQGNIQTQELQRLDYQSQILHGLEQKIWRDAGLTPTMRVLDLGCGTGIISQAIAQSLTSGSIVGVDRSPAMVLAAQNRAQEQEMTNLTFQVGSSENLNLPSSSCDFVYARLLFQHLSNPQETLSEIQRVLKPGGIICIVDVDNDWTMFHPPVPSINTFQQYITKIQQQQGGDPQIGRKLGGYLTTARFAQIKTSIEIITSDYGQEGKGMGLKAFLDLFSFGAAFEHGNSDAFALGMQAKTDASKLLELPYAWAGFGLFIVTGINLAAPSINDKIKGRDEHQPT
jgi:ubiquinone/menaquinone biosynthesis C-methylase UbiE